MPQEFGDAAQYFPFRIKLVLLLVCDRPVRFSLRITLLSIFPANTPQRVTEVIRNYITRKFACQLLGGIRTKFCSFIVKNESNLNKRQ